MWLPDREKLVKILLHSNGEDVETPWAEDLGPAEGRPGARRVRLGNVPFLHAKPTYGDVIVVEPDDARDGRLCWNSRELPYESIRAILTEDGGRWVMIVDYTLTSPATDATLAFNALDVAGDHADLAVEGCYGPRDDEPGRAYVAVPASMDVETALAALHGAKLPMTLTLVHPVEEDEEEEDEPAPPAGFELVTRYEDVTIDPATCWFFPRPSQDNAHRLLIRVGVPSYDERKAEAFDAAVRIVVHSGLGERAATKAIESLEATLLPAEPESVGYMRLRELPRYLEACASGITSGTA